MARNPRLQRKLSAESPALAHLDASAEQRANDLAMLARMKELEKKFLNRMTTTRLDPRTVVSQYKSQ